MSKYNLEPGLLQVFRLYAWLQFVSFLILPVMYLFGRGHFERFTDPRLPILAIVLLGVVLLVYLYWPVISRHLGNYYIPVAVIFSSGTLILQQHLFSTRGFIAWQGYPFLTILLILVAWQYRYSHVVAFTLGTMVFDLAFTILLPPTAPPRLPLPAFGADSEREFTFLFLIANSATLLVVGYVVNRLVVAQRKQRQALGEANQKLVSHASALEQLAVSRERVRLSRELHDILAHTLSAQAVQLEALLSISDSLPAKVQSILSGMQTATRSGLDETRRALSALRASPLDELGLARSLRTYAEDFADRHSLKLEVDVDDDPDDLPPEVEQTFYRVAQEALENTGRHAQAHNLDVRLLAHNGRLNLAVTDDGRGFSTGEAADMDQFGLVGMRERAEMIGASLFITSQPGKGTTVEMEWERSE